MIENFSPSSLKGDWRERAERVIPGGASTGSKRAAALFGDEAGEGPTHFTHASGCRLTTTDGVVLVDCTMALGAVALGYGEHAVVAAVQRAAADGNVSGLSPALEVEIAERLCEVIPCAEQVRFLKTGAEAVAAAVRIARTATGRDHVIGSGYFGWLDWWTSAAGVPHGAHADFTPVPFDDIPSLRAAASRAGSELAAIVLEPVVERLPDPAWITAAADLCAKVGAVLILDEVKTGFRLRTGGYQEYAGVRPHLAVFGKAMANGFPIAAVAGNRSLMETAQRTWISSTLAGESCALAAVGAVLDHHERGGVCERIWSAGLAMQDAVRQALRTTGVHDVTIEGIAPMWLLRWPTEALERTFVSLAAQHGALVKRGAYNFGSVAHDSAAIATLERAVVLALDALQARARA